MKSKKEAGFTYTELLVTCAVIAILTTIIIGGLNAARAKGRDAQRISDVKQLQGAIENFFSSCYKFPEQLYYLMSKQVGCSNYQPVLAEFPTPPLPNEEYYYYTDSRGSPSATGKRYHVCATLEYSYRESKGKAGSPRFYNGSGGDPCDGTNERVFDAVGGAY